MSDIRYVVMSLKPWSSVEVPGCELGDKITGTKACGFLLAFKSKEDAQREFPDQQIIMVREEQRNEQE